MTTHHGSSLFKGFNLGRGEYTIKLLSYSALLHLIGFVIYYPISVLIFDHLFRSTAAVDPDVKFSLRVLILIIPLLPGTFALLTLLSPINFNQLENLPNERSFSKLYICITTRGTHPETVVRGVKSMAPLLKIDPRIQLSIATRDHAAHHFNNLGVDVVGIPGDYKPAKAQNKARSQEYFRIQKQFTAEDWILHLDEETFIDEHCLRACLKFIQTAVPHTYGQGIILYNSVDYWKNPLLTYGDLVRVRNDLGRFQFAANVLHAPINGCHGPFLLVNGALENDVGWDTDCNSEDWVFTMKAWSLGHSIGFIPGIAREQSPPTIQEFLEQRKRWLWGILSVSAGWSATSLCAKYMCWLYSNFEIFTTLAIITIPSYLHIPLWCYRYIIWFNAAQQASLAIAIIIQDIDANIPPTKTILRIIMLPFYQVVVVALHLWAVVLGCWNPPVGFHVTGKA